MGFQGLGAPIGFFWVFVGHGLPNFLDEAHFGPRIEPFLGNLETTSLLGWAPNARLADFIQFFD